jgi:hypothetical protein
MRTLLLSALLVSCGPGSSTLTLTLTGAEPLKNGFHYEGWAIVGGQPVATGKFNIGTGGALVTVDGAAIAGGAFKTVDLAAATDIVITIEPSGDTDAVPADTHYLAGPVAGGAAALTVKDAKALGSDFLSAAGKFVLATPTDGMSNNENSGIWFLELAGSPAAPAVGLTLPTLPAGWKYEGWAVIGGKPVTTGVFTAVTGADAAAPYSGTEGAPPFPGEDFVANAPSGLTFPTDLAGAMTAISIEPSPDDDAGPFTLKPLLQPIASGATDHTNYTLGNNASTFPTGAATIK